MIKYNHPITFLVGEFIAHLFAEKSPTELVFIIFTTRLMWTEA